MKTMTCKELGGACDMEFKANTFEEMAELSKSHGMEMYQQREPSHLKAMEEMQNLMKDPAEMARWFDTKKKVFEDRTHDQH